LGSNYEGIVGCFYGLGEKTENMQRKKNEENEGDLWWGFA